MECWVVEQSAWLICEVTTLQSKIIKLRRILSMHWKYFQCCAATAESYQSISWNFLSSFYLQFDFHCFTCLQPTWQQCPSKKLKKECLESFERALHVSSLDERGCIRSDGKVVFAPLTSPPLLATGSSINNPYKSRKFLVAPSQEIIKRFMKTWV